MSVSTYALPTDLSVVASDYVAGKVRRDVATRLLQEALLATTDAARIAAIVGAMRALAAASKPSASRARETSVDDYAAPIAARVIALRTMASALEFGTISASDVPTDMREAVSYAVHRIIHTARPAYAADKRVTDATTAPAIARGSVTAHYADIASGRATRDGKPFLPEVGRVLTYVVIAGSATPSYPSADMSDGAAAAPFAARNADIPGWTYVTDVTIPDSRARRGVRFDGVDDAA